MTQLRNTPDLNDAFMWIPEGIIVRVVQFNEDTATCRDVATNIEYKIHRALWERNELQLYQLPWPKIGSRWTHKNGNTYVVTGNANKANERNAEYPQWVEYKNVHTDEPYGRKLVDWYRSMTPVPAKAPSVNAEGKRNDGYGDPSKGEYNAFLGDDGSGLPCD